MKNALTTLSLTAMAVTTLISGCASKPPMPEIGETFFETKINPDGTKLFAFSISTPKPEGRGAGGRKGGGGGGRGESRGPRPDGEEGQSHGGSNNRQEQQMDMLYKALDEKLAETRYCRDGYIEIDTHETEDRVHILGECNDAANELDRLDFPNP